MSSASLRDIEKPVREELLVFRKYFKDVVKSRIGMLNWVLKYLLKTKGKQIRPLLVLLSAKAIAPVSQKSYTAAALLELLHTATLVHDDVVDEANKRRGFFTINALWKNKASVLVGDFLLSRGMLLALENKYYSMLEILSRAVKSMSEGELLQMEKSRKPDLTEAVYMEIVKGKTASLLAAACATGAASVTDSEPLIRRMETFGLQLGMAFQIKDDLLDMDRDTGKTRGRDLLDRKITLPVIGALSQSGARERRKMQRLIAKKKKSAEELRTLFNWIEDTGGLAYARDKMIAFRDAALETLDPLEDSESKFALQQLCHYVTERRK